MKALPAPYYQDDRCTIYHGDCIEIMPLLKGKVDAIVSDPYMGSGSTGVACLRTGRRFIGIEIDEAHCATAAERLRTAYAECFPVASASVASQPPTSGGAA